MSDELPSRGLTLLYLLIEQQIDRLTRERDVARREVCEDRAACIQGKKPEEIAAALGWDCFRRQP